MKITTTEIRQIIKEETTKVLEDYEMTDLTDRDPESPMTDEERDMDAATEQMTEFLFDDILTDAVVDLPTGERENLDGFLAALGNMVVTGGITNKDAMIMVRELSNAAKVAMKRASANFIDEDYAEDQKMGRTQTAPDYYDRLEQDDDMLEEKIKEVDGGYFVTSKSGKHLSKKPHKTKKAALAQLRAVEANS